MASDEVHALLITGTYGSGKSTLAEELAEVLEDRAMAHAAIDLDWLMWFDVPGQTDAALDAVFPANLAAVVANYLVAGVRYVVLAGAVRSQADLAKIREAVGHPIQVVRLHVPWRRSNDAWHPRSRPGASRTWASHPRSWQTWTPPTSMRSTSRTTGTCTSWRSG